MMRLAKAAEKVAENSVQIQAATVSGFFIGKWTLSDLAMIVSIVIGVATFITSLVFKYRQDQRDKIRLKRGE